MRKLISIIRHEDLAHIMAEVAVVKFTMMIQKVTLVTPFKASRQMAVFASVLLADFISWYLHYQ